MIFEKSSDDIDMASQLQQQLNDQALARARLRSAPQQHPDFDGEHCLVCEVDMPPSRLAAGRIRCTECEESVEQRNKQHRR